MVMRFSSWPLTLAALVLSAAAATAQTRATSADLSGVVSDQTKGVLPGVTITVTNADTGLTRTSVTDADGRYAILALPPGTYTVRTELQGFAPQERTGIALALGSAVDLPFTLAIAGAQEQVVVVAEASLVDAQKTAVASVVSQQQIESLPINGRNFISFSIITPGVTTDRTPQQGASATSGLTFAGQRARSNNITVDGLDNNDATRRQRARDVQPGGGARVPGAHQLVLGGVRQGLGRRRQHRHQERHQHGSPATCSATSATRR